MDKQIYFGSNITYLLEEKNMYQAELATLLNRTRPSVNSWIHKNVIPPIDEILFLSEFFSVTIEELLFVDLSNSSALQNNVETTIKQFLGSKTMTSVFNTEANSEDIKNLYTLLSIIYKKRADKL